MQDINQGVDDKMKASKLEHWEVLQLDPRGGSPCFANSHLVPEYASYDPPSGFTAEEIMQFQGAQVVFTSVNDVRLLLQLQKELGSLEKKSGELD